jgi:hypothetical protein
MSAAVTDVAVLARMDVPALMQWGRTAIETAGSFDAVRDLKGQAEALRVLLRAQGASLDAVNIATQLRIRAERRMGEILAASKKADERGQPIIVTLRPAIFERDVLSFHIVGFPQALMERVVKQRIQAR